MYPESDLLPISALQHLLFCERQCALIHIERVWADNRLTVEGQQMHETVHDGPDESHHGVRIARGLPLRSLRLGLVGVADVVEFHQDADPLPVEYKRGRPKRGDEDRVQLCAQALCLEEMLAVPVPAGALFYGRTRRRFDVPFDDRLRARTERAAADVRVLIRGGVTPPATRQPKCRHCSLRHLCLPAVAGRSRSVNAYLHRAVHRSDEADDNSEIAP